MSTENPTAPTPQPVDFLTDAEREAIAILRRPPPAPDDLPQKLIVNRKDLENILREVQLVRAVVQTASHALPYMNVEDVADVLSSHADVALSEPIEALATILGHRT